MSNRRSCPWHDNITPQNPHPAAHPSPVKFQTYRAEYEKRIIAGSADDKVRFQNEPIRISAMAKNIFNTMNKFSSEGSFIVSTGMGHAHRLGANLLLERAKPHNKDLDFNVQVFDCTSKYTESDAADVADYMQAALVIDSSQIKEIYKTLPWMRVQIEVEGTKFSIPPLEEMVNTLSPQVSTISTLPYSSHSLLPRQIRLFDITRTSEKFMNLIDGHISDSRPSPL